MDSPLNSVVDDDVDVAMFSKLADENYNPFSKLADDEDSAATLTTKPSEEIPKEIQKENPQEKENRLFVFIHGLKSDYPGSEFVHHVDVINKWADSEGLNRVETRIMAAEKWRKCKHEKGQWDHCFAKAKTETDTIYEVKGWCDDDPRMMLFIRLCRQLQICHPRKPFRLPCAQVALTFDISPDTANRWIHFLEEIKVIKLAYQGGWSDTPQGRVKNRKASEFRYIVGVYGKDQI